jgi:CRISPR-associated protein Csm1
LAKNENHHKIKNIQKELDKYFLENFFGQNGFIISSQITTKDKILSQKESMEKDLTALGKDNEIKKLNKFDLLNCTDNDVCQDPFEKERIHDKNSCKFCNKRIATIKIHKNEKEKACPICFNQIELGKELVKKEYLSIFTSDKKASKENIEIIELNGIYYYADFSNSIDDLEGDIFDITSNPYYDYPKWSLKSHVDVDENREIKTFSEYIEENGKTTSSGLMALKADIDKLGDTFRELYREDFRLFNRLSREVEFFFSDYITSLVAKRENIYTVFAGGDDLFLIGEYREVMGLVEEIQRKFFAFSLEKTTISMGLVMFKPSTPINIVSDMADRAEKRAKIERDSIDIFGVSMKFDEFYEIEKDLDEVVAFLEKEQDDKTAFYYKLIELCDMRENLYKALSRDKKYKNYRFNPQDALWKSKLNYLFRRNVRREDNDSRIFNLLNSLIEKGEKFKPLLFLKIYNNRDKKQGEKNENIG